MDDTEPLWYCNKDDSYRYYRDLTIWALLKACTSLLVTFWGSLFHHVLLLGIKKRDNVQAGQQKVS